MRGEGRSTQSVNSVKAVNFVRYQNNNLSASHTAPSSLLDLPVSIVDDLFSSSLMLGEINDP